MLGLMQVVNILPKCYELLVMSLFQFVKLKIHTYSIVDHLGSVCELLPSGCHS